MKVELTKIELGELYNVATNGYADGEYYEGRKAGRREAAFNRAMVKLRKALEASDER